MWDTGSAVPAPVAQRLMREPIERANGLGIGLFNLARQAGQAGYVARLSENRDGAVCFSLSNGEAGAPSAGNR